MSETIKGNCPHCGKPLEIPAELEEFSCLYCGERMPTQRLTAPEKQTECSEEDRRYLREKLAAAALNYPDYFKKLSKKDFFPAFETYETENRAVFERLEACAPENDAERAEMLRSVCGDLMDDIAAGMEADPRWAKKHSRSEVLFEKKVVLAIFMTPALRKQELSVADPFCQTLHGVWMERYPKEQWTPGNYETLIGGFKKFKFCFITTATCVHEGKPDDCAELTAFRAFRDGWLRAQPEGEALIREYYDIAPAIVACVEYCDDPDARYDEIRRRWLEPCYRALQERRPAECLAAYRDMVSVLKEKYLH